MVWLLGIDLKLWMVSIQMVYVCVVPSSSITSNSDYKRRLKKGDYKKHTNYSYIVLK